MASAGEIGIDLTANTSRFTEGMDQVESRVTKTRGALNRGAKTAAKYGGVMAAAGVAVVGALVKKGIAAADAQATLAKQLKTTSTTVATLGVAARRTGSDMDTAKDAARELTLRLSEAATGGGPAKEAIDRLGLSAERLSRLPLAERIATVNRVIREQVPASQQAATAAAFFGEEVGFAMQQLSPEVMAQAREEAKRFGLAMSEIDAEQIGQARNSMGRLNDMFSGATQQLAAEFSPMLSGIADKLSEATGAAGGMKEVVGDVVDFGVKGFGMMADAAHGLRMVFEIIVQAGKEITAGLAQIGAFGTKVWKSISDIALAAIEGIIGGLNKIPGIDIMPPGNPFAKMAQDSKFLADSLSATAKEGREELKKLVEQPMPSEQIKNWRAEVEAESEKAAKAAIKAREKIAGGGGGGGTDGAGGEGGGEGGSSAEQAANERRRKAMEQRLTMLRESLMTERELKIQAHEQDMIFLKEALNQEMITEQKFRELSVEKAKKLEKKLTDIKKRGEASRGAITEKSWDQQAQQVAGALSSMTQNVSSESRTMFEIQKAAGISEAVVNTYSSATKAYNAMAGIPYIGPALGAAAAAAAIASGIKQVQTIQSQSFGKGGASGGGGGMKAPSGNAANAPGGAGGGAGGGGGDGGDSGPQRNATVNVRGDVFDRETVMKMGDQMKSLSEDGYEFQIQGSPA